MKVYYDQSPAGAGKTKRQVEEITSKLGKFLFFTERIASFAELAARIGAEAARNGMCPIIDYVHSGERLGSVSRQIEELPTRHRNHDHVIVLATHSGMKRSDLSGFMGWEVIVDEVPQFLDFEQKCTGLDVLFFQQHYNLHPLIGSWSCITANRAGLALTAQQVRACQSHDHLVTFHERVLEASKEGSSRHILCNLPDWTSMADDKVEWCWASAFSLMELSAFDKVTLLGNRFRADIGSKISEALTVEPIEWIELPKLTAMSNFMSRVVHIRYFSEERAASSNLFKGKDGAEMLPEIGKIISQEIKDQEYIWTANDGVSRAALEAGGMKEANYLSPRQAGTNNYRNVSHAAVIFSAKASPMLESLLKFMGIDPSVWDDSVECETILQFVTRTSVRVEGNMSPVQLWVFDRQQAQYLKDYFDGLPYATATLERMDSGPPVPAKATPGRKKVKRSPEEHAEYKRERRRKDAERKRRARALEREAKKAA
ncbi:hypothetical protein [Croceicoccus bisphenolivorans]|uniref:hypothetical protein n=1 Tax=Croceicoccus bisphenolivorans TaxID=1783232 RepID=UPI000AE5DF2B|nr:hypothetical protein [Croceicoccus bisphenolivorans]